MKKKSAKKAAATFKDHVEEIEGFLASIAAADLSDAHISWAHDYAVIRLYREFEDLMLNCLVAAINNDTEQLSATTGVSFPKHLTDEVCEYVIRGNGYFDFRGPDGLIQTVSRFLPGTHYLVTIIKNARYKDPLDRLSALRNFATHDSATAKRQAASVTGMLKLSSAGAWLKKQNRVAQLLTQLKALAADIETHAPY